jgi:hypothetical protein
VLANRVLRRIFGLKWDEMTGGWRKLHSKEFCTTYAPPSTIRMIKARWMRWAGNVAYVWVKKNASRLLVEKPERRRPLGRPRCKLVDNIKKDLRELGWHGMCLIDLAHDRDWWKALVKTIINKWVSIRYWEVPEWFHNWWPLKTGSASGSFSNNIPLKFQ